MTGSYDLMLLLVALLDLHPAPCRRLRIATLCYNRRNAVEMLGLLETKKIGGLTLLASTFFAGHNKELHERFREELAEFPGSQTAAARSHAKVVLFRLRRRRRVGFGGFGQPPHERQPRATDAVPRPALHDWHAAWIDTLVSAMKATRTTIRARVDAVLAVMLDGAMPFQVRQYVAEKEAAGEAPDDPRGRKAPIRAANTPLLRPGRRPDR